MGDSKQREHQLFIDIKHIVLLDTLCYITYGWTWMRIFIEGRQNMNAIMCELCGSNDVVKQGDYFVCQHCGTKYSLEDAKKLIKTVKIDNSENLSNLYELARRAKDSNNWEDAQNYYGQIVQQDAHSWEAYFYSVYYRQLNCKIYQIANSAGNIQNAIHPTIELIQKYVPKEEQKAAYTEVAKQCTMAAMLLKNGAKNHYNNNGTVDGARSEYKVRGLACANIIWNCAQELDSIGEKNIALTLYKTVNSGDFNEFFDKENMDKVTAKIHQYDSSYTPPPKQGGCYVATAVYGSYDCPQVWTLRRYRDYTFAETWHGRAFIRTYYAISPMLVKWFGETQWFKNMWKPRLDMMVKHLNDEGVADTPYQDRKW